jgi:23S rRNA (cytidine1920-2'-O)/16S rRNA (cytidine1409-2'-O)-methyltransferase
MSVPGPDAERLRLDELLVRRGFYGSRSRARDAVVRGAVAVDGAVCRKPGQSVAAGSDLSLDDPARAYVSRAALKLVAGLDRFGFDPAGTTALDVGASTGGFTEVLLERGAARVLAIDVGHGQIAAQLRADPRVTVIEGLNARDLTADHLGGARPEFLACDVSFISLTLALPPALGLAAPRARAVLLVKPQFEAGRAAVGKSGLLKRPADGEAIARRLEAWLDGLPGWRSAGLAPSPVAGGDGNREWLLGGIRDR